MSQRLVIVIVNWNAGRQLQDCLDSVKFSAAHLAPEQCLAGVVVVDNASTDGSADALQLPGLPLQVLHNTSNCGFAAACNQGAAASPPADLLLFLNPDTRLFDHSLVLPLQRLAEPARQHTGIVGIQMVDEAGQVARSCARFPTAAHFAWQALGLDRLRPQLAHAMREWDHDSDREVDQVIGAFFMIRRPLFDQLGGFDERFFVYFEEVDLALRAAQAGWRSLFLADASSFHQGGGTSDQIKGRRLFYSLRSRLLYGAKHFGAGQRALLSLVTWLVEPLSRLVHLALQRRWAEIRHLAEGYSLLAADRWQAHAARR